MPTTSTATAAGAEAEAEAVPPDRKGRLAHLAQRASAAPATPAGRAHLVRKAILGPWGRGGRQAPAQLLSWTSTTPTLPPRQQPPAVLLRPLLARALLLWRWIH